MLSDIYEVDQIPQKGDFIMMAKGAYEWTSNRWMVDDVYWYLGDDEPIVGIEVLKR